MVAERCGRCLFFKEVEHSQPGLTEYIGACAYEAYQASTPDELARAELSEADPLDEPCEDYKEEM